MDLASLDLEAASAAGVEVEIKHPVDTVDETYTDDNGKEKTRSVLAPLLDSKGKPVVIRICGTESAQFKASSRVHRQRFKGQPIDVGSDEFTEAMIDILADCTLGWSGVDWEGEPFKFTRENAFKLYSGGGFRWLVKQLMAATGDHKLIPLGQKNG